MPKKKKKQNKPPEFLEVTARNSNKEQQKPKSTLNNSIYLKAHLIISLVVKKQIKNTLEFLYFCSHLAYLPDLSIGGRNAGQHPACSHYVVEYSKA
jgi:hypothetical protein